MAEARSAVAEPRIYDFKEGKNAWKDLALGWRHSIVRSFYRTRYSLVSWWHISVMWHGIFENENENKNENYLQNENKIRAEVTFGELHNNQNRNYSLRTKLSIVAGPILLYGFVLVLYFVTPLQISS